MSGKNVPNEFRPGILLKLAVSRHRLLYHYVVCLSLHKLC